MKRKHKVDEAILEIKVDDKTLLKVLLDPKKKELLKKVWNIGEKAIKIGFISLNLISHFSSVPQKAEPPKNHLIQQSPPSEIRNERKEQGHDKECRLN